MIFRCKVAKSIRKMAFFASKKASTATFVTLLPPLLPPLNILNIKYLSPKVAVVAVKITKCLVQEYKDRATRWQLNRAFSCKVNRATRRQLNRAFSCQVNRATTW